MSWDHGTYGWEAIEQFSHALGVMGIAQVIEEGPSNQYRGSDLGGVEQNFRIIRFATSNPNKRWVAEEYLAVKDGDCDGSDQVRYEVYEEGHRPDLEGRLRVLEAT